MALPQAILLPASYGAMKSDEILTGAEPTDLRAAVCFTGADMTGESAPRIVCIDRSSRAASFTMKSSNARPPAHGLTIEYDANGKPTRFTGGADPRGEGTAIGR